MCPHCQSVAARYQPNSRCLSTVSSWPRVSFVHGTAQDEVPLGCCLGCGLPTRPGGHGRSERDERDWGGGAARRLTIGFWDAAISPPSRRRGRTPTPGPSGRPAPTSLSATAPPSSSFGCHVTWHSSPPRAWRAIRTPRVHAHCPVSTWSTLDRLEQHLICVTSAAGDLSTCCMESVGAATAPSWSLLRHHAAPSRTPASGRLRLIRRRQRDRIRRHFCPQLEGDILATCTVSMEALSVWI